MNEISNISRSSLGQEPIRPDFIPADRYTGEDIPVLEKERLWPRIWHIACREEEIPNVGDYATYEIFDESIIIVRTAPDKVSAYYNVCQHRGRRLVNPGRGHTRGFFCGFHGWKWNLSGENTYVQHPDEWAECPEFNTENLALKSPKVDRWGGWIWVNMDPSAEPLLDWLGDIVPTMEHFDLPSMRRAWHQVIVAPVNWKVVVEAFNEGYHAGATHDVNVTYFDARAPGYAHGSHTNYYVNFEKLPRVKREDGKWSDAQTTKEMLYYQSKELHETLFSLVTDPMMKAVVRLRDELPDDVPDEKLFARLWELQREEIEAIGAKWPEKLTMEEMGKAGIGWHIFPNTIFLPAVDGLLWYRLRPHPEDTAKCVFDIWSLQRYAPGKEPEVVTRIANNFEEAKGCNPFLEQDFSNMLAVELGMRSRGWRGARVNPSEELQVTHFHRMLDRYNDMPPLES